MIGRRRRWQAWRAGRLVLVSGLLAGLLLSVWGCLPDPQRVQSVALLDRLVAARAAFAARPTAEAQQACDEVGEVQTRLYGEPGLTQVQPAWSNLRDAAEALQAVCGQSMLLALASGTSPALEEGQQRWQAGIQREIGVACEYLRGAAQALGRTQPC